MYAFVAVILFLLLYYIRPQEWVEVLKALSPVKMVMILGFIGLLARPGGVTRRSLLRTPHDWLMLAFILWMIYTADSWKYAFDKTGRQALGFYIVIVGALTTLQRINVFLLVWSAMIVLLSLFAVASLHGFDPMGSEYLTMVKMGGRLSVNTSIFNNPNALGHSVVPVLIMLYYQFVWKRPIFVREVAVLVMALPLYCLYLTQSKGAFVAGFVTILGGLTFGRSRYTQIFLIVFALTVGVGSLGHLPRMDTLSASDAGIQGRLVAFSHGLNAMMETKTGVGYGKWWESIVRAKGSPIAAHSS